MRARIGIYTWGFAHVGGSEKRTLVMAEHLSRRHDVVLVVQEPLPRTLVTRNFQVDLSRVRSVVLDTRRVRCLNYFHRAPAYRLRQLAAQLDFRAQLKAQRLDVFIHNAHDHMLVAPVPRSIFMCMFPDQLQVRRPPPGPLRRLYDGALNAVERRLCGCRLEDTLSSYAVLTANSGYTAEWIQRWWGRPAEVVYSVGENMGPPAVKERIILHVGRFACHEGRWWKGQDVLLEVFKDMKEAHRRGWQLVLAGSVGPNAASQTGVGPLAAMAAGYPVRRCFDVDFATLRDLYRRAAVYWHATGFGLPVQEYPCEQEHFGNTTVEAMSAGAVPVALNSGGSREIVTHGEDGYLWDDRAALAEFTSRLIDEPDHLVCLSRQAVASSARFGRAAFGARVERIVDRLLGAAPSQAQ